MPASGRPTPRITSAWLAAMRVARSRRWRCGARILPGPGCDGVEQRAGQRQCVAQVQGASSWNISVMPTSAMAQAASTAPAHSAGPAPAWPRATTSVEPGDEGVAVAAGARQPLSLCSQKAMNSSAPSSRPSGAARCGACRATYGQQHQQGDGKARPDDLQRISCADSSFMVGWCPRRPPR